MKLFVLSLGLIVLLSCVLWREAFSACDSYGGRCTLQVGDIIHDAEQPVVLSAHQGYYISFTVSSLHFPYVWSFLYWLTLFSSA